MNVEQMTIGADMIMHGIVTAMKAGKHQWTEPAEMTDEGCNVTEGKSTLLYIPINGQTETFIAYYTGTEVGIYDIGKKMVQWIFRKSDTGGWSGLRPINRDNIIVSASDIYEYLLLPLRSYLQ